MMYSFICHKCGKKKEVEAKPFSPPELICECNTKMSRDYGSENTLIKAKWKIRH